ncbi:MAG: hypothetical protein JNG83_07885 [Opitutaceae bacterium]|nr:hypothetical protein [Opitutaceae bacterium]
MPSLIRRAGFLAALAAGAAVAGAAGEPAEAAVTVTHDAAHPGFNYYGRWHAGRTAVTVNSGALVEFAYTGDSCVLAFDVAGMGHFPGIFVQVDNGPVERTLLSAGVSTVRVKPPFNTRPQGTPPHAVPSSRHHLVRFWVATHSLYRTPALGTQWTTLEGACRFAGADLAGGDLVPLPYQENQIEFLGDSHTQGLRLLYTGTEDDIGNQRPYAAWPQLVADLLGLKPVVTGFGGQGLTTAGTSGAPPAIQAFPFVHAGAPWQPVVRPRVVVIYQGANGSAPPGEFGTLYADYLRVVRGAYPEAVIFAVCPHHRPHYAPAIRDAVAAQRDRRMLFLDYSTGVISRDEAADDPQAHLNPGGAVRMATRLAADIAARLQPGAPDVRLR